MRAPTHIHLILIAIWLSGCVSILRDADGKPSAVAFVVTIVPMEPVAQDADPALTGTATITNTGAVTTTTPIQGTLTPSSTVPPGTVPQRLPAEQTATATTAATQSATATPSAATAAPTATATTRATSTLQPTATTAPPTRRPTTTPTSGPTLSPTPTRIPDGVFLGAHSSYRSGSSYVVVGEVANPSAAAAHNTGVIAQFYDANDEIVAAAEVNTLLQMTDAGALNPFRIEASDTGRIQRYELTLVWDDFSIIEYRSVKVTVQQLVEEEDEESEEPGRRTIVGEIRNDNESALSGTVVVVTLYDAAGQVVDAYQGFPRRATLEPGEGSEYSIALENPDLEFDHFMVQAQGMLSVY